MYDDDPAAGLRRIIGNAQGAHDALAAQLQAQGIDTSSSPELQRLQAAVDDLQSLHDRTFGSPTHRPDGG